MVEGGVAGPVGGAACWAKARPVIAVAAATPATPTSVRRDSAATLLSSNRFDELMSVTPNGFLLCEFYQDAEQRGRISGASLSATGSSSPSARRRHRRLHGRRPTSRRP